MFDLDPQINFSIQHGSKFKSNGNTRSESSAIVLNVVIFMQINVYTYMTLTLATHRKHFYLTEGPGPVCNNKNPLICICDRCLISN